jgi:hypothetical protein
MKPHRIFFFLCGIFLVIGLISLVSPVNGIHIRKGITIRIPSVSELFFPVTMKYADISKLTGNAKMDSVVAFNPRKKISFPDTIPHPVVNQFLEYPDSSKTSLDPFFRSLAEISATNECIHILHYGDSQLEADRITEYLRFRFQSEFGGEGPGFLPFSDEVGRISLQMTNSGNWNRFSLIGTSSNNHGTRPYGPLATYFRFTPFQDSLSGSTNNHEAWIKISGFGKPYGNLQQFNRCRIFYANNHSSILTNFLNSDQLIKTDTLVPCNYQKTMECNFSKPLSNLKIQFHGLDSPDFYGICLDDTKGVSVDNIPLRGSSGLEFTRMDPALLKVIFHQLNARLMILQFGVNAIPGNLPEYSYYENGLYRQLSFLKKENPDLAIIVISVSDASQKTGEQYESYASVEKIVGAQKAAARKAGCVFWNLYQAMGGKNSMPSWVFAKQPLATTDFLHFNFNGSRLVAKMFYSALIHDYNDFIMKRQ